LRRPLVDEALAALSRELEGVPVSRATLAPPEWLALGASLASEVSVLLAQAEPPEHDDISVIIDATYVWPLTGATRRIAGFRKPRVGGAG
jgi:16S rRNA (guanine527-N7)-methyltransferase